MRTRSNRVVDDIYNPKNYPRLYRIWANAKYRCNNPNANNYKYYGGKGISFCEEWNSFAPFCEWALSNGYKDHLTLDRKETDKGYSPDNCRWVTIAEQDNNRSTNINYNFKGEIRTLSEWSNIYGLNYDTVLTRYRNGKRGNELFKPIRKKKEDKRFENIKYSDATLMGWTKSELVMYIKHLYETTDKTNIIDEFAEQLKNKLVLRYGSATPTEQYVAMQVTEWCNEIAEQMKGE